MDAESAAQHLQGFGPFVLDLGAGQLLRDGQPVELAPRPWAVLSYLVSRAGLLVTKDELLDAVWGHRHVTDAALKVAINGLRAKLGDDASAPSCIATVSRRGYRFIAPLTAIERTATQAAEPIATAEPPLRPPPRQAAPDPATPRLKGNLPAAPPPLVGRGRDMAALCALLRTQRLITLLGPGGVGKTQLALAAARHEPPADGVWLVRLDALDNSGPPLEAVARALSLGANASRDIDMLARALSPLAVRIVLDNAEHLIDVLVPLVGRLLADAPQVSLLVTSQTALRLAGETLLPLRPLDVPPPEATSGLVDYPAVALFIARVRAQLPAFAPDDQCLADIATLCRLLDGLPLAIELAAARVPLLGTAGVRQRLSPAVAQRPPGADSVGPPAAAESDRFVLLSRGARDAPPRHRTLRQALEWSFALLDEPHRRIQRRLSACAGSFTLATARAVAAADGDADSGGWEVLEALQVLHDQSLLAIDADDTADPAQRRFRQLESVRALAAEQLRQAGEEAATQTRLVGAMCELFQHAQAHFTRTPLLQWLRPLRPEADNLRLAMTHAVARLAAEGPGAGCSETLRLAVGLFSHAMLFWLRSGRKREALDWFKAVAPHAARIDAPDLQAHYGLAVGSLAAYAQSMPPADALPWLEQAERLFTAQGDPRSAMLALYLNAALMQRIAPHADRQALLARMRALEQPDWSLRERNFAAWTEAVNAHGRGDLQAFRDFCALDLQRARAADDKAEAWVAAFGLGQALWTLGEHTRAALTLAEAVDDLRACGLLREYATTAGLAASMRLALASLTDPASGDLVARDAADLVAPMREAADVMRAEGMLWWMGDALMMLPARRGDWPAALQLQTWIDERMQALSMQRSPVAQSLRDAFDRRLAVAQRAADWREPAPVATAMLDDATVLRLSFG